MVNLILATILVGLSTFFILEALDYMLSIFFVIRRNLLNLAFAPLISAGNFYLLDMWDTKVITASLASAFLASILERSMNRPTVLKQRRNYL